MTTIRHVGLASVASFHIVPQLLHRLLVFLQGVSFLGQDDEFVMSGSDCGHIYVWERESGEVQAVLKVNQEGGAC